jgi:F-type H+-transporting ATPase subunit beta
MAKGSKGQVVQVIGTVVDLEFPAEQLPAIYDAVEVETTGDTKLIVEVQQHLGNNWVRCLAMDTTDGLARGTAAVDLGAYLRR